MRERKQEYRLSFTAAGEDDHVFDLVQDKPFPEKLWLEKVLPIHVCVISKEESVYSEDYKTRNSGSNEARQNGAG